MSMYDRNHYNIVFSLQLIKKEKERKEKREEKKKCGYKEAGIIGKHHVICHNNVIQFMVLFNCYKPILI